MAIATRWFVDDPPPAAAPAHERRPPLRFAPWAAFLVAPVILAWSYSMASTRPADDQPHYAVFWLGMLTLLLPVGARLMARRVSRHERLLLVIGTGLVLYLPKLLRATGGIVFHDEYAHARQVQLLVENGRLGDLNPLIQIVQSFPGLHSIAAYLGETSGLGTAAVVATMIALCHALALVGVFLLAETVTGSPRIAGVAALIYTLNASYLYFDAQFSYESLSLPLMFWTLVAVDRARRAWEDRRARVAWAGVAVVIGACCVVTHHLTSYVLAIVLAALTVVSVVRAWRGHGDWPAARLTALLWLMATAGAIAWGVFRAPLVKRYLEPRITEGFGQLFDIASRREEGHELFAQSTLPQYERLLGFAVAPIALAATLGGLWLLWRQVRRYRQRMDDMHIVLVLLGMAYLPSFPLLLSIAGNEGARRSWAHSYLGVTIIAAPFAVRLWDRRHHVLRRVWVRGRPSAVVLGTGLAAAFTATLIGNTAVGLNETYRFPGPYVYGSDTRSVTPELVDLSRHIDDTYGAGNKIVGDRYTTLLIGTVGRQSTSRPSTGFPVWQMYFDPFPTDSLLGQLKTSSYRFMVIDSEMARFTPKIGVYFEPDEPLAQIRTDPPPLRNIAKYEQLPFTLKVEQSNNFNLYRFDFPALDGQRAGMR